MATISEVNAKIVGTFTGISGKGILNVVGWIVVALIAIGAAYWYFGIYQRDKKLFSKFISIFDVVGAYWQVVGKDKGKVVKIGSGGFEIIYLKKQKVYRIAYGGRVGKDTYYFFIMPDGYWYNGMLSAGVNHIDEKNGLVPIVTTNPLMRGQYTALEKQIDLLHGEKIKFWDRYGSWVLSIGFVLIAGVMLWLNWKEFATVSGNFTGLVTQMAELLEKLNNLAGNLQGATGNSGLVPA